MNQVKPSYSTAYVAKRLGVSVPTVQRWVDAGRLKAWKTMGGHRRVDAESADELFRQQDAGVLQDELATPSVVIVDDNPDDRDLLVAMIETFMPGARITTAQNGYEGLLKIGQEQPDIVVTDIVMPTMDGLELLSQLVQHTASKPPLVLVVSSLTHEQIHQRGRLPDGVRLVPKPLEQAEFAEALDGLRRNSQKPEK
jgi:excisionase family DNA binding protein